MRLNRFSRIPAWRLAAAEILFLVLVMILVLTCSCSMLPGMLGGGGGSVTEASPAVAEGVAGWVKPSNLMRFGWLSVILVLVFPSIRKPITSLWTAIFGALAIPFIELRRRYEGHRGS